MDPGFGKTLGRCPKGGFHNGGTGYPNSWLICKGISHENMDDEQGYSDFRKAPNEETLGDMVLHE